MSQAQQARDLSNLSSASFQQRLFAYTIDLLLVSILTKVVTTFGGAGDFTALIGSLLTLFYFVFSQHRFQRTLGKHVMGLRVVSNEDDSPLSWGQLILRETIGRTIMNLTFWIAYLLVLFSEERRGLHDRLAKTRVVTTQETDDVPIGLQLVRGLGILAGVGVLIGGAIYYAIFYTTLPMERLQSGLYASGIRMKGISGSLRSGFVIQRIDWQDGPDSFELEDLYIDLASDIRPFLKEQIRLKKLTVGRAKLKLVSNSETSLSPLDQPELETEAVQVRPRKTRKESPFASLTVDEVDLRQLTAILEEKTFSINRFYTSNLVMKGKVVELGRVYVDSPDFAINLMNARADDGFIQLDQPLQVTLRKSLYPQVLRSDLDFQLKMRGESSDPLSLEASAFKQRLRVQRDGTRLKMDLNEWSPGHHLQGYWPLNRLQLNLDSRGDLKTIFLTAPIQGKIFLHNVPFIVAPQQSLLTVLTSGLRLSHQRGQYQSAIALRWMGKKPGPWMMIKSTLPLKTEAEELSYLYYGKALNQIDSLQQRRIAADVKFFSEPLMSTQTLQNLTELTPSAPDQSPSARTPANR